MSELPPHPGAPRWVKVFGILALLLLLIVVVLHLTGRGFRDLHGSSSTTTEHRP
jgi:hypothetical protein